MADKEFDFEELEKIWKGMAKETFTAFAMEHLGYKSEAEGPPDCIGSGNKKEWCWLCPWQELC